MTENGKPNSVLFDAEDFLRELEGLTWEQRGFYWTALLKMYDRMGGLPADDNEGASLMGADVHTFCRLRDALTGAGKLHIADGELRNRGVEEAITEFCEAKKLVHGRCPAPTTPSAHGIERAMVPAVDPDVLVACVASIDRLQGRRPLPPSTSQLMAAGIANIVGDEDTANAAFARLAALMLFLDQHWDVLATFPDRDPETIPEPLVRAAAVATLDAEHPKAFDRAALLGSALRLAPGAGHC
jgi:hypothetical protein